LIGATTNAGLLIKPLFDRFIFKYNLDPYSDEDLEEIIKNTVKKYNMGLSDEALAQLVKISRGVPRIALNRLEFIKNYLLTKGTSSITIDDVGYCLELEGVSEEGYTLEDITYINALRKLQPAGIETLVSATNLSRDQIENVIEPYLLFSCILKKSPSGRVLV
jgi:Holliday junction DNA helicase RuvB